MLTMTFDKGLETEKTLDIMYLYEHPLRSSLNGSLDKTIKTNNDFIDVSAFIDSPDFQTLEIVDENGMEIPLWGGYNYIQDITTNYSSDSKNYSLSITISKKRDEEI